MKTKTIIITIASASLLANVLMLKQCSDEKQTFNAAIHKANESDSIKTAILKSKNIEIDSIKRVDSIKTAHHGQTAAYWEKVAKTRSIEAKTYKNRTDSLAQAYNGTECKDIIEAFSATNNKLESVIVSLDSANFNLAAEAAGYSRQLFQCEKQRVNSDSIILSKENVINTYKSEFDKYECYRKWVNKSWLRRTLMRWKCK